MTNYQAINHFCPNWQYLDANNGTLEVTFDFTKKNQIALPRPSWIIHVVDCLFHLTQLSLEERKARLEKVRPEALRTLNESIVEFAKPGMQNRSENALRAEKLAIAISEVL